MYFLDYVGLLFLTICFLYFLASKWNPKISLPNKKKHYFLITGAGSGIGKEIVLTLDKLGFNVFACCYLDQELKDLEKELSSKAYLLQFDITKEDKVEEAAKEVLEVLEEEGTSLFGIVNNAGVFICGGMVEIMNSKQLKTQFEVNCFGHMNVTRIFLPIIRKTCGFGRIINVVSVVGRFAPAWLQPYSASKFAMTSLTNSLRSELSNQNISVSSIEPGFVSTPLVDNANSQLKKLLG